MKKITLILLLFSQICFNQELLTPEKTISFGLNSHTNRDEAFFTKIDSQKNIILVGTTERDSTFTDILITKLSLNYDQIWQKRVSVPTNLSYDLPLKLLIDIEDNIFVVGRSSFNESFSNGLLFIAKYDKNGKNIFYKTIGNIDGSDYTDFVQMDALLNSDNSLRLYYSTNLVIQDEDGYDTSEIRSTFFLLNIDSIGKEKSSYHHEITNYDFKAILYNKNLSVITRNPIDESNQKFSFNLHTINENGDLINSNIDDDEFNDKMNLHYYNFVDKTDISYLNGSIFLRCESINSEKQTLSKIFLDGKVSYCLQNNNDNKYFSLGKFTHENKYVVNNLDQNTTVYISIDENNNFTETKISDQLSTGFKDNNDGSFFLTTSNSNIKLFSSDLDELNSFNTSNTYNLIDFLKIDNSTISTYGIIFNKMYPESNFFSQLDQFAEKITKNGIEKEYIFSGEGTSSALHQKVYLDNNDNYIVFSVEKIGPECYFRGCEGAPLSIRILKYDSNLNKLWEFDFTNDVNTILNFNEFTNLLIDDENNIYYNAPDLKVDNENQNYSLYKLSSNGELIFKERSIRSKEVILNKDENELFIISHPIYSADTFYTELSKIDLSTGIEIDNFKYNEKRHFNHLLKNGNLYVFLIKDYIYENHSITVFKEDSLLFERLLWIDSTASLTYYKTLIKDETLIFVSNSSSRESDIKFHTIDISNNYNSYEVSSNLKNLFFLENDILTVDEYGFLKIYDSNFKEITKSKDSYEQCCGFLLKPFNNNILLQTEGSILFLNKDFQTIKTLKLPHLFDANFLFDNENHLVISDNFGNGVLYNPQYSWRRGFISKYNIQSVLSSDEFSSAYSEDNFKIFPNPSTGIFNLKLNKEDIYKVYLYDLNGKLLDTFNNNKFELKNYVNGLYVLKIISASKNVYKKIIIKK